QVVDFSRPASIEPPNMTSCPCCCAEAVPVSTAAATKATAASTVEGRERRPRGSSIISSTLPWMLSSRGGADCTLLALRLSARALEYGRRQIPEKHLGSERVPAARRARGRVRRTLELG